MNTKNHSSGHDVVVQSVTSNGSFQQTSSAVENSVVGISRQCQIPAAVASNLLSDAVGRSSTGCAPLPNSYKAR